MHDPSTAGATVTGPSDAPTRSRGQGRRLAAAAALAVAFALLAACSSGDGATVTVEGQARAETEPNEHADDKPDTAPGAEVPTVPPTEAELGSILLSPEELRGSWEALDTSTAGGEQAEPLPACMAELEAMASGAGAGAVAGHTQGDRLAVVQDAFWLDGASEDQYELVVAGLDQCRDMSFLTPLGRVDGSMGPLRFDLFGDEATAYRLLYTDLVTTLTQDIAVVRVDEVVTVIWRIEEAPVPSSPSELERLAAAAVDKINRVGTDGRAAA